jgi:hypothetical protein
MSPNVRLFSFNFKKNINNRKEVNLRTGRLFLAIADNMEERVRAL